MNVMLYNGNSLRFSRNKKGTISVSLVSKKSNNNVGEIVIEKDISDFLSVNGMYFTEEHDVVYHKLVDLLNNKRLSKDIKSGSVVKIANILFDVIDIKDESPMLISRDIIEERSFDENGSNKWSESSIRRYLNKDFFCKFTNLEKNSVSKTLIDDYIRLLSVRELALLLNNPKKIQYNSWFWLMNEVDALGASHLYMVVSTNGVNMKTIPCEYVRGVRPVLGLKPNVHLIGAGTVKSPIEII